MDTLKIGFKELLRRAALDAGYDLDEVTGDPVLTRKDEHQLAHRLTEAMRYLWQEAYGNWTLPESLLAREEEHDGGYIFNTNESGFLSVWEEDPRALLRRQQRYVPVVRCYEPDGQIFWKVINGNPDEIRKYFVFTRRSAPVFTARLRDPAASYFLGDRVWERDGDGEVWRRVVGSFASGALAPSGPEWEMVQVPARWVRALLLKVNYDRMLLDANMPENAGRMEADLREAVDMLQYSSETVPGDAPWLFTGAEGGVMS